MNKHKELLLAWCEYLINNQTENGGFRCEACDILHGRADNAVFPLLYEYNETGDKRFLDAAGKVMNFRKLLSKDDGSVQNDFESPWRGITAFSAVNLFKSLFYFEKIIPEDLKSEIEKAFVSSAKWVHENIVVGFHSYINYYAASSAVNAMYGIRYGDGEYLESARELLKYCLSHFTENGFLSGEGQPHDALTEKGCVCTDIGYEVEESLPCLVDAAEILNDEKALMFLTEKMRKLLKFMLPDGAWDNSFGSRNYKWTYYGSRTSDGCLSALVRLGKYDDIFFDAAERNFELLYKCTVGGRLFGGMDYDKCGVRPCVHHTFCHAVSLADALLTGFPDVKKTEPPIRKTGTEVKYFPETDTYKVFCGKWIATFSGYDYFTSNAKNGAAHSSGGALSMLYHEEKGTVIAGSVYEYKLTEPNNMQRIPDNIRHSCLIPRAEYERDGELYTSCLDGKAEIKADASGDTVTVETCSGFVSPNGFKTADEDLFLTAKYVFDGDNIKISVCTSVKKEGIKFILPIISDSVNIKTEAPNAREKIFFLPGGFSADEYTFSLDEKITVTLG
ncbi:MAG: hypothetical protein K6F09_00425 [Clostridiales bacterium]|nr:hypothetical protein [Clostridiales bacterium]